MKITNKCLNFHQTCVMDYLRKKMGKPRPCATCGKVLKNNWDGRIQ